MFAYCLNNPVMGCDPCGTCFHRWDFWNDCEKCGGKTIGAKWNDGVSRVNYHHNQEIQMQNELAEVQRQLISDNIQTGINRRAYHVQMQVESRYEQDMVAKEFIKNRFSTPQKTGNTLAFLGSGIQFGYSVHAIYTAAVAGASIAYPIGAAMGAGLVFVASIYFIISEGDS